MTYTAFPVYPIWPTGVAQAPQTITSQASGNVPPITDEQYATQFKSRIATAAKKFEEQFNPHWQVYSSRGTISGTYDSSDTVEAAHKRLGDATETHFRSWIGLVAAMKWFMGYGATEFFSGLARTFNRAELAGMVDKLEAEFEDVNSIEKWYKGITESVWTAYHNSRQVWATADDFSGQARAYTAPNASTDGTADWFKELKTVWYDAARWDNYPSTGTLTLSDTSPETGQGVTATLVDPAGPPTNVGIFWQVSDDDGATKETRTTIGATYTPNSARDTGKKLRAVAGYKNADGFELVAISNWSENIAAGS